MSTEDTLKKDETMAATPESEASAPVGGSAEGDMEAPPLKPFSKHGSHAPTKGPSKPSFGGPSRPAEPSRRAPEIPGATNFRYQTAPDYDSKKLIVGKSISLSGEITSCDKLVVEGTVKANLTDARVIEVAQTGYFEGTAAVDEAEISGRFEGELTATKRLVVRATGQIKGTVRYASIVIEPGGEVHGAIQVISGGEEEDAPLLAPPRMPSSKV